LLEREIQSKTCWNVPTKVYFTAIQINKSEKPAFVGTLELRNEKQPPPQPKIFFQAVLICWNEKINQNHVGIFLYNLILLFFSHIDTINLILLERWNCGTKNNLHYNLKIFFQTVHTCWIEIINQNHVGKFLLNLILLFFNHIDLKNLLLLESWNCGTKNNPHHNQKKFRAILLCWNEKINQYHVGIFL